MLKRFEITHALNDAVPSTLRPVVRKLLFQRGAALKMHPGDRQYLVDYYREDVMKLAALLDRDLSMWLV